MISQHAVRRLDQDLTVTEVIGEGGGGRVVRAHAHALRRDVAVKILTGQLEPAQVQRFFKEALRTARLDHPHIVHVYDFGTFGDRPCIVMSLVRGPSLKQIIDDAPTRRVPWRRVAVLALQACDALAYAHDQGIVHRDIKPANLLVTKGPGPTGDFLRLVDFGIAIDLVVNDDAATLGKTSGTPEYMSPAQCHGAEPSPPDDIYSLGVSMYEALTGTRPFRREDPLEAMRAHSQRRPAPVHEVNPEVPRRLSQVVMDALSVDPDARPTSARAMGERLGELAYGSDPELRSLARAADFKGHPEGDVPGTPATLDPLPGPAPEETGGRWPAQRDPTSRRTSRWRWRITTTVAVAGLFALLAVSSPWAPPEEAAPAATSAHGLPLAETLAQLPDLDGLRVQLDALSGRLGVRLAWGLSIAEARAVLPDWTYEVTAVGPSLVHLWGSESETAGRSKGIELVFGPDQLRMVYVRLYDHLTEADVRRELNAALGPPSERRKLPEMTGTGSLWFRAGGVVVHRTFCSKSCWTGVRIGASVGDVL